MYLQVFLGGYVTFLQILHKGFVCYCSPHSRYFPSGRMYLSPGKPTLDGNAKKQYKWNWSTSFIEVVLLNSCWCGTQLLSVNYFIWRTSSFEGTSKPQQGCFYTCYMDYGKTATHFSLLYILKYLHCGILLLDHKKSKWLICWTAQVTWQGDCRSDKHKKRNKTGASKISTVPRMPVSPSSVTWVISLGPADPWAQSEGMVETQEQHPCYR